MKTKKKVVKKPIFNKNKKRKVSWLTIIPIALIIISFGIIGIFAYKNYLSKNQIQSKITENSILPEEKNTSNTQNIIPTITPSEIRNPKSSSSTHQFGTHTIIIKYDSQSHDTSLILKEGDKEILISKQGSYVPEKNYVIRNNFVDFLLSSDDNYLVYRVASELEGSFSEIYDFKNKKKTVLGIIPVDQGFTINNKYFYACTHYGYGSGGVFIYSLPQMNVTYQNDSGRVDTNCNYNQENNTLDITREEYDTDLRKTIYSYMTYSFNSNKIIKK